MFSYSFACSDWSTNSNTSVFLSATAFILKMNYIKIETDKFSKILKKNIHHKDQPALDKWSCIITKWCTLLILKRSFLFEQFLGKVKYNYFVSVSTLFCLFSCLFFPFLFHEHSLTLNTVKLIFHILWKHWYFLWLFWKLYPQYIMWNHEKHEFYDFIIKNFIWWPSKTT